MEPVSVMSLDEHGFIWVYFGKFGIEVQYAPEDCNRHSGNDNCCAVCAEPDNEKRSKRRFWQTVQDDQIRLQDFRKLPEEPEKDGDKKAEEDYQDKTAQGFVKSHSDMTENTAVTGHFQKTQGNPGRTAENERVDQSCICSKFPEKEKTEQNQNTGNSYDAFVFLMAFQIKLLTFRNFIHCGLTPSISD